MLYLSNSDKWVHNKLNPLQWGARPQSTSVASHRRRCSLSSAVVRRTTKIPTSSGCKTAPWNGRSSTTIPWTTTPCLPVTWSHCENKGHTMLKAQTQVKLIGHNHLKELHKSRGWTASWIKWGTSLIWCRYLWMTCLTLLGNLDDSLQGRMQFRSRRCILLSVQNSQQIQNTKAWRLLIR